MIKHHAKKDFITIPELADLLGVSRIAVFKKVKSGAIQAKKAGRIYLIPMAKVNALLGRDLTVQNKNEIETAVKRTVQEYGEVLKMLGGE
jgi:excisionase family DNA binding protein